MEKSPHQTSTSGPLRVHSQPGPWPELALCVTSLMTLQVALWASVSSCKHPSLRASEGQEGHCEAASLAWLRAEASAAWPSKGGGGE